MARKGAPHGILSEVGGISFGGQKPHGTCGERQKPLQGPSVKPVVLSTPEEHFSLITATQGCARGAHSRAWCCPAAWGVCRLQAV